MITSLMEIFEDAKFREVSLSHALFGVTLYKCVNYLLASIPVKTRRSLAATQSFKRVAVYHNMLLCVYSLVSLLGTIWILSNKPIAWQMTAIRDSTCKNSLMEIGSPMYGLLWIFYASKYYEFVDTWLIILQGKTPKLLQTYHHIGAVFAVGLLCKYNVEAAWIFCLLNSGVHSVMYFYYTLTLFGIRPWWKVYITSLQLIQFFMGFLMGIMYFALPCAYQGFNRWATAALAFNYSYVFILVFLFKRFFRETYSKKSGKN